MLYCVIGVLILRICVSTLLPPTPPTPGQAHLVQRTFRLKVTVGQIVVVVVSFTADGSGNLKIYDVPNPPNNLKHT